jgi:hypothetical protein
MRQARALEMHMNDIDLVTVATFPDAAEADLARERLALEGIVAFVLDDQGDVVMPFMIASTGGIRLQVAPADAECAQEILG